MLQSTLPNPLRLETCHTVAKQGIGFVMAVFVTANDDDRQRGLLRWGIPTFLLVLTLIGVFVALQHSQGSGVIAAVKLHKRTAAWEANLITNATAQLQQRLDEIEQRLQRLGILDQLQQRLEGIEANLRGPGPVQHAAEGVDAIFKALSNLEEKLKSLPGSTKQVQGSKVCDGEGDPGWTASILQHERKNTSQTGEDGVIEYIFNSIGTTNKYFVEFGVQNGDECNTRFLREHLGWKGLMMDGGSNVPEINLHQEFISPQNINQLFEKYKVPEEFDLLSIDVDYDDWYIWRALDSKYKPRVVITEYNSAIPLEHSWSTAPDETSHWLGDDYMGCSLRALWELGKKKGYTLVYCLSNGVNAFFVQTEILQKQGVVPPSILDLYIGHHYHAPNTNLSRKWVVFDKDGNEVRRQYVDVSKPPVPVLGYYPYTPDRLPTGL